MLFNHNFTQKPVYNNVTLDFKGLSCNNHAYFNGSWNTSYCRRIVRYTHTQKSNMTFPTLVQSSKPRHFSSLEVGGKKKGKQKTQLVGSFVYCCRVIISEMSITVSFLNQEIEVLNGVFFCRNVESQNHLIIKAGRDLHAHLVQPAPYYHYHPIKFASEHHIQSLLDPPQGQ